MINSGTQTSPSSERHDRGTLDNGTVVGSYVIERVIAEGGMGTVYAALHQVLPRRAAIKVLHRYLLERWSARERLLQEACILETLDHPGLVSVFDVGLLADGRPWIAMEQLDGETLAERIRQRGRLDSLEVVEVMTAVIAALGAAHRSGVIHRDLKPDNILLLARRDGDPLAIKIIDWGIARIESEPWGRLTQIGMTPGTPFYMSPEQARGKHLEGSSDIYALGVIVSEALCGEPPFRGDSPIDVVIQHLTAAPPSIRLARPDVPAALEALAMAMLNKEPEGRPSLPAIREELDRIGAELRATGSEYEEVELVLELIADDNDDRRGEVVTMPPIGVPRWTPPIGRSVLASARVHRPASRRERGGAELLGLIISTLLVAIMLAGALAMPALELGRAATLVDAAPLPALDRERDLRMLPATPEQTNVHVRF